MKYQSSKATIYNLNRCYKILNQKIDKDEIVRISTECEQEYKDNYQLYHLLEDLKFLKTAYNQIQEMADNLEPDVKAKFLSYPIPAAIVEEWEKVK